MNIIDSRSTNLQYGVPVYTGFRIGDSIAIPVPACPRARSPGVFYFLPPGRLPPSPVSINRTGSVCLCAPARPVCPVCVSRLPPESFTGQGSKSSQVKSSQDLTC